jgi:hypothetical protein
MQMTIAFVAYTSLSNKKFLSEHLYIQILYILKLYYYDNNA